MLLACSGSYAQGVGLQVADTADTREPGRLQITPGAVFGDDVSFYGIRETYSVFDELRAFLDLGAVNADGADIDFGGQAGALACIPSEDVICDLALRAAVYYVNTDTLDLFGSSLMLLASDESLLDGLYLYCGAGGDLCNRKKNRFADEETEINPALTLGALYQFSDSLAAYVEASYVDDIFVGTGVRFR